MNEKLNIKESTNVIEDEPENKTLRKLGQKVLNSIIEDADVVDLDKDQPDWDDFQVEDEGTSKDQRGVVTVVPTEMIEEIESVNAA